MQRNILPENLSSKHFIIILICSLALSGFVSGSEGNSSASTSSSTHNTSEILSAPDIQSILSNPENYLGKIVELKGVVSRTYPGQQRFAIADRVGCSLCAAKISRSSIAINYSKKIPKYLAIVQISGILTHDNHQGYLINATSVVT